MHPYDWDVSLLPDPSKSPPIRAQHGDTAYYFFETPDLPLFGPLRTLGVPEPVIDVFEPFFREIVELGYDRSIPPWEPTPARLIPQLKPVTVAGRSRRRDRGGDRQCPGPHRFASAAERSHAAATADGDAAVEQIVSPSEVNVEPPRVTATAATRGDRKPYRFRKPGQGGTRAVGDPLEQGSRSPSVRLKSVVGRGAPRP